MRPACVVKRDGSTVPFDSGRIAAAIGRALAAVDASDDLVAGELAQVVMDHLERISDREDPGIEDIQDAVVHVLQESGRYEAAVAFVRYRDARERSRRAAAASGSPSRSLHLVLIDSDGHRRPWRRDEVTSLLAAHSGLSAKEVAAALPHIENVLSGSDCTELGMPLLSSLLESGLVSAGMHVNAARHAPLRLSRSEVQAHLAQAEDGSGLLMRLGGRVALAAALADGGYPLAVQRLWSRGRLWIDGIDDPRRISQITRVAEAPPSPWHVLAQAMAQAITDSRHARRVRVVLPATILGHLERGLVALHAPINALASLATVYLYCDGRTPLLNAWPFDQRVGLGYYLEDYLLQARLQGLGLPSLSGPHLTQSGWSAAVAVDLALNAQGLEGEFTQLDQLAMAAVAAARTRLAELGEVAKDAGVRFAIFGLAQGSASNEYLDRQVVQEGLRTGLALTRGTRLCDEACAHLGRLLT